MFSAEWYGDTIKTNNGTGSVNEIKEKNFIFTRLLSNYTRDEAGQIINIRWR
jgi:hypothetical protein